MSGNIPYGSYSQHSSPPIASCPDAAQAAIIIHSQDEFFRGFNFLLHYKASYKRPCFNRATKAHDAF